MKAYSDQLLTGHIAVSQLARKCMSLRMCYSALLLVAACMLSASIYADDQLEIRDHMICVF